MIMPEAPQLVSRKWYFSRKEIDCHTPSRSDGIDYKHEEHLRKLYCTFLQELGIELKVPQATIATAVMFCHRFYMRQSHAKNDWQTIATVCMFLASKAEDTPQWLRDLVVVAYKLIYKWDPSASRRIREIYDKQKDLIVIGERLLLNTIAFEMNIEHPYKPLVAAVKRLGITNELLNVAWSFVNDWLHTSLCLQHKPHYVAAASLFLAAKVMKVKLTKVKGKPWWMEFDVSPKLLEDVIQQMLSLLEQTQTQTQTQIQTQTQTQTPPAAAAASKGESVKSNYVEKEAVNKETGSDTGSATSVVEDGECVTVKCDISSSCKIVKVEVKIGNSQLDVDKIREKLKRRSSINVSKRKRAEDVADDEEAWIERELENGIVMEASNAQKKIKG